MAKPKASLTAVLAQKQPSPVAVDPAPAPKAKLDDGKMTTSLRIRRSFCLN
jgi:hypothetical protein